MDRARRTLAVAAIGTFMATLDSSIVNISLPVIAADLAAGLEATQWVQIAYSLGVTALLLVAGRMADLVGRRRVYVAGLVAFTAASVACGAAPDIASLIAGRGVQAVGAAMIMANGPALVAQAFEPGRRGRALAVVAVTVSVGLTLGSSAGGFLTSLFGWRSIFFVNLPIGLGGAWYGWRVLGEAADERPAPGASRHGFDWPGALASAIGVGLLLLAVSRGAEWGWGSAPTAVCLAAAGASLAAFVRHEARAANPLLPLDLFRNRTFRTANVASLLTFTATVALTFLVPFYLVTILSRSPAEAGLIYLAAPLSLSLLAPVGGRLADRAGTRGPQVAGLALVVAGLLLVAELPAAATTWDVVWRLVVVGAGQGLFQTPNNTALLSSAPMARLGVASGLQAVMRNLGLALGVAIAGALVAAAGASLHDATFLRGFRLALRVSAGLAAAALVLCAARGSRRPAVQSDLSRGVDGA